LTLDGAVPEEAHQVPRYDPVGVNCAGLPVGLQALQIALDQALETYGVWSGLQPAQLGLKR
jgi:hypothetical protein